MSDALETDLRCRLALALRMQADALVAGDLDAERRHHYAALRIRALAQRLSEQRHAVAARGTYAGDRLARLLAPEAER